MSVLSNPQKITATGLKALGYWRSGWGSPSFRATHNTNMYEWLEDEYGWHIMWFPKKFEGWVTPGTCCRVDVRGRCVMSKNKGAQSNVYYMSPVLGTMSDLEIFISQVDAGKWPPLHEQLREGTAKYC